MRTAFGLLGLLLMFLNVLCAAELFFETACAIEGTFLLDEAVHALRMGRCPLLVIVRHIDDQMIARSDALSGCTVRKCF